ncbi:MAG: DinB family protein [Flavisolibacter sp.]|nr:DinB family protein [Flavisolibacter sp.]
MHTIKQLTFFFLLMSLGFSINGKAQTSDSLLNQLSAKWKNAKTYTLEIAELMPEEQYNFKPVADEMTFGEQLLHVAQNMNWLSSAYLLGSKQNSKSDANVLSKQSIINTISTAYDSALAVHYRLIPKQLDEVVPFFAGPKSRRQILILMHDHQTHHIGQLIVYLRLKDIKPPAYVGW